MDNSPIIVAFDPGFTKLGLVVLDRDGDIAVQEVFALKQKGKLTTQTSAYEVTRNMRQIMIALHELFKPDIYVIEMQIGKYQSKELEILIVSMIPCGSRFVIQSAKRKLQFDDIKCLEPSNPKSKKYNQTKNIGQQLATVLSCGIIDKKRDVCDAFLHALYFRKQYINDPEKTARLLTLID